MGRVFTNGPGVPASMLGQVMPKTQKMVLDNELLNIQNYKVRIKRKGLHPLLHLGVVANEKWAYGSPSTTITNNNWILIEQYFSLSEIHMHTNTKIN